ncbi:MAG: LacI family DNA-binding transcriptional regulator [Microscillaceae bacterium]|nr:LacI family DNA-binding transcriptional regulator [Microscillaceae bacterium]
MKNNKGVTIYDLAKELNVSPSTVSRALKGHHSIGKETIEAVKKLAQQRGYQPNRIAASLRQNKTDTIGVMIPLIHRPFISSLISGVEIAAKEMGYNVIISQSHDSYEDEVSNAGVLYASRVSGLVVSLAMETQNYDHFKQFIDNGIPVVFVDRVAEKLNLDTVVIDNFSAGFEATCHLIEQGCKRIAHFAGAQHRNVYRERQEGYLEALKRHHLPIDESLIVYSNNLDADQGWKSAEYLFSLPNPPDGIFSANDTAAVSAIQFMKKTGIQIPDKVAIIGFNNDPASSIIDPQLSTVMHPAIDMGKIAAQQVLKQKKLDNIVKSETIVLKTTLIIRESSLRKK